MTRLRVPQVPLAANEERIAPQAGPQTQFLACNADIAIFGGAAGGGKSMALLIDALRYAALDPRPGFGAVIFRRTSPQITATGGLWEESGKLYPRIGGKANQSRLEWKWAEHKTHIRFSHMQYESDMYDWQGSQIAYIGFDELTHFTQAQFFYMLSRNRTTCGVKPRVRATVNPDADSWVKSFLAPWVDDTYPFPAQGGEKRYFYRDGGAVMWIVPGIGEFFRNAEGLLCWVAEAGERAKDAIKLVKSCTFIPAKLSDNPALLKANPEYQANIAALDPVERERLMGGPLAWNVRISGNSFQRHWFEIVSEAPAEMDRLRWWDFAGTKKRNKTHDPDFTVGLLMGRTPAGIYYVLDIRRGQWSPKDVRDTVLQTAQEDGYEIAIRFEQEPGSAGKMVADDYITLLDGYDVEGKPSTGDKQTRARPFIAQAQAGNVKIVRAWWNNDYLNELVPFPNPLVHDDQVDGSSGAHTQLAERARADGLTPTTVQFFSGNQRGR